MKGLVKSIRLIYILVQVSFFVRFELPLRDDLSPGSFRVDQHELGKILLIASTVLLLVSLHAFYSFSGVEKGLENLSSEADETMALLDSDSFNSSLQALREVDALNINRKVENIISGMGDVRQVLESSEGLKSSAEKSRNTYQWLTLFSLLGIISGAVLFLMER